MILNTNPTCPTIHSNGTSRESLLKQYKSAIDAVNNACDYLQKAYPHGRDYYVQGGDALKKAQDEHQDWLRRLVSVKHELIAIATDVYKQKKDHPAFDGMIKTTYRAIDGYTEEQVFSDLDDAITYAHKQIGSKVEIGSGYAVSYDGVGKITVIGCLLKDIWPNC